MTGGSMTTAELVEEVSRFSDLTKQPSEVIVDTVFKRIIHSLHRAEWCPGGAQIFGELNDRSLAIFDAATAKLVRRWPGPDSELTAAVVAPAGRLAATVHKDRVLRLWDLDAGRELARWEGHDTAVGALAFSPDNRALVSGDADGTLKLWDLEALRRDLAALGLDWE